MDFYPSSAMMEARFVKTSYFGTTGTEVLYGVQFDNLGFPYIMGTTTGAWPVINATFSQANGKQFIAKLKPDISAYVYSTTIWKGCCLLRIFLPRLSS